MKIVCLIFGGGNVKYYNAVNRLVRELKQFYKFDEIVTYTDMDLEKTDFYKTHKNFITSNKRGFGYWIWKPYYVHTELLKLDKDDILVYLDCGFEINPKGFDRFFSYLFETKNKDSLLFHLEDKHSEKRWNKMDTIKRVLGEEYDDNLLDKPQIMASAFLLKKCDRIMNFVREWLEICEEYKFINDEVSNSKNFPEFIEHRHDQSVFSLLAKKYKLNCIFDETWPDTMVDKDSPLRAMRKYN